MFRLGRCASRWLIASDGTQVENGVFTKTISRPPKPVMFKVPMRRRDPQLTQGEVKMGRSMVACAGMRPKTGHIENLRKGIRTVLPKDRLMSMQIFPTYALSRRPFGVGRGAGRGPITDYMARVVPGQTLVNVPNINPMPHGLKSDWRGFRKSIGSLSARTAFRDHTNHFKMDANVMSTPAKLSYMKD